MNTCSRWLPVASIVAVIIAGGCTATPRFAQKGGGGRSTAANGGSGGDTRPSSGGVLLTLEGTASYYADDFNGKQAANGEIFDMNDLTAAHRTFPFGTRVRVTNLVNKKSVTVR